MTATSASARLTAQVVAADDVRYRTVEFAVEAPPTAGPLTWSQQQVMGLLDALAPATDPLNLRFRHVLPAGTTEEAVLDALRVLVQSHEALRTRYASTPDGPGQQVAAEGRLDTAIVDFSDAQRAGEGVAGVMAFLADRPFDIAGEWPLRVALITADERPRYLVFAACHLVMDGDGALRLRDHLRRLLTRAAEPGRRRPAHGPLAEAAFERSPAGVRNAVRAVEHHELTYSAMPQTMVPRRVQETELPRYRYLAFDSEALALALPALAARHRTSPATVLYAGFASVSAFVSGLPRAYLQMTVSNRIEPRLRDTVGCFAQDVPVCVEVADASVADVIERAAGAVLQSARFGRYPPAELAAARRRVELRRGVSLDLSCWLNYQPYTRLAPSTGTPTANALADARSRSRARWVDGTDNSTSTYFVFVEGGPKTLTLTAIIDTAVLPASEAVAWLRTLEQVLCAAVGGDVDASQLGGYAGLVPRVYDRDWCLTDAGWVCLPDVAELVRRASGAPRVTVLPHDAGGGPGITAYLQGSDRTPGLDRLHAACVAALSGQRSAMAPHRYVVCAEAWPGPDVTGWQRMPVLAEGSGR